LSKGKKITLKILKIFGWILLGVFILIIGLLLFIRSPWGQDIVVTKATEYLEGELGTRVEVGRLFITFRGDLYLEDLYMEDQNGDTLVYSRSLETGVALLPLIRTGAINISRFQWEGFRANIHRDEVTEKFNFDYILEAFLSDEPGEEPVVEEETEGDMPEVSLGPVRLTDFHLTYRDEVMGIDSYFIMGSLALDMERLDLNAMNFYIEDFTFDNSEIYYRQTKPFEPTEEDTIVTDTPMPVLIVDNFAVNNVKAFYESIPDGMMADVNLGHFLVNLPEADLERNRIMLKHIRLHDSEVIFKTTAVDLPDSAEEAGEDLEEAAEDFEWPDWLVEIGEISLQNNNILYQDGETAPREGYFNAEAVHIQNLNLLVNNFYLKDQKAGLRLDEFNFRDESGFALHDFTFKLAVSEERFSIDNLRLRTNKSFLEGNIALEYNSIQQLIDDVEHAQFAMNIPRMEIHLDEAYLFAPDLRTEEYFREAARHPLRGQIAVAGDFNVLDIPTFSLDWANDTRVRASGSVRNPMDVDNIFLDFDNILFESSRRELTAFVDEEDMGVRIPESIRLESSVTGSLQNIRADAALTIPEGRVNITGSYRDTDQIAFSAELDVIDLDLGEILQNPEIGVISFSMETQGQGSTINELDATLTSNFRSLELYGENYTGLSIEGEMRDGRGDLAVALDHEHLDFDLTGWAILDSVYTQAELILDLRGADLYELGATSDILRTSSLMTLTFDGNLEDYNVTARLENTNVLQNRRLFQLGPFGITARVMEDSTSVDINSEILRGFLRSNSNPEELVAGLQRQFNTYLSEGDYTTSLDTIDQPVQMRMQMSVQQTPILTQVFLDGLEQMDSISIEVDFDESLSLFAANVSLPYLLYSDIEIDSLGLRVLGEGNELTFNFGLASLETGPVSMGRTYFDGDVRGDRLFVDFTSYDDEERLVHLSADIGYGGDTVSIHLDPENLIFNRQEWNIPMDNEILLADQFLNFHNFIWSRAGQELAIRSDLQEYESEHIGVTFENFELSTFLTLLNPDEPLASGILQGVLVIENPFGATGIIADLNIEELTAMEVLLGNLSLNAQSVGDDDYDFNLALKDRGIDLDLVGGYIADPDGARLNLQLDLNELQMEVLTGLSGDQLRDGVGSLSGNITVQGSTAEPNYEGVFRFNEAAFTAVEVNNRFRLSNEVIRIDNTGLYLDKFTVRDEGDNQFVLNGEVLTEDLTNPTFNLNLSANNFRVINSTEDDNELFYGTASIDADVDIGGDLTLPDVRGTLRVRSGTELTFVVPETQLDLVERDGTVIFVNKSNPDDIMTRPVQEPATGFSGFRLRSILEIDRNAVFNVIVDERSGDNLRIAGEANLSFDMDPNGRMFLSGSYEVSEGHYEMSLYQLVSRRFEIDRGSRITWAGDPMDAMLDISAIYRIRTSSSELMSTQLTGADAETRTRYRQELPFLVYLDVQGELLRPEIGFRLDMPEDQRGAIGGNVYTRVQQVNQQADELNRQVFSLLVLNRFFPDTGGDGTGGGASAVARSSVSQVLSGQLNALAGNVLGGTGVELDFDLDSYTDYQTGAPQDRTQLNVSARRSLMNERLIVQVGSQMDIEGSSHNQEQAGAVLGNVSVEYLLTPNGRYRLRGFRRNQFESIVDGQLIVTGMSLIFNREFNRFRELWWGIDETADEDAVNPISEIEEKRRREEEEREQQKENEGSSEQEEDPDNKQN
jgi:translocation and assembly module TamB